MSLAGARIDILGAFAGVRYGSWMGTYGESTDVGEAVFGQDFSCTLLLLGVALPFDVAFPAFCFFFEMHRGVTCRSLRYVIDFVGHAER